MLSPTCPLSCGMHRRSFRFHRLHCGEYAVHTVNFERMEKCRVHGEFRCCVGKVRRPRVQGHCRISGTCRPTLRCYFFVGHYAERVLRRDVDGFSRKNRGEMALRFAFVDVKCGRVGGTKHLRRSAGAHDQGLPYKHACVGLRPAPRH